jgi:hypothetical protein
MTLEQYMTVRGTFRPKRTDDLRPAAREYVGKRLLWNVAWKIEDGPYEGQWALTPCADAAGFGWAPEEDVEVLNDGTD